MRPTKNTISIAAIKKFTHMPATCRSKSLPKRAFTGGSGTCHRQTSE